MTCEREIKMLWDFSFYFSQRLFQAPVGDEKMNHVVTGHCDRRLLLQSWSLTRITVVWWKPKHGSSSVRQIYLARNITGRVVFPQPRVIEGQLISLFHQIKRLKESEALRDFIPVGYEQESNNPVRMNKNRFTWMIDLNQWFFYIILTLTSKWLLQNFRTFID